MKLKAIRRLRTRDFGWGSRKYICFSVPEAALAGPCPSDEDGDPDPQEWLKAQPEGSPGRLLYTLDHDCFYTARHQSRIYVLKGVKAHRSHRYMRWWRSDIRHAIRHAEGQIRVHPRLRIEALPFIG